MIGLCSHLVLEALPAILVLNGLAGGATRVYLFEESNYPGDRDGLGHPPQEVLHSNHVEGGETLDVLVLLLMRRGSLFRALKLGDLFKNCLLHSVEGTEGMTPDQILLGL